MGLIQAGNNHTCHSLNNERISERPTLSVVTTTDPNANKLPHLLSQLSIFAQNTDQVIEVVIVDDLNLWPDEKSCSYTFHTSLTIRTIWYPETRGQLRAMLCGLLAARNDQLLTIDPDMHPCIQDIPAMQSAMAHGYLVVHGTRPRRDDISTLRRIGSAVANIAIKWITNIRVDDIGSPVSLIDREVLAKQNSLMENGLNPRLALYMMLDDKVLGLPLSQGSPKDTPSQYSTAMLARTFLSLVRHSLTLRLQQKKGLRKVKGAGLTRTS